MKHLRHRLAAALLALLLPLSAVSGIDSWSGTGPLATGLGNQIINALAVSPDGQTVYAGNGSGTVLSYVYGDAAPAAFSFTDQTDVATSTLMTSNTITVSGINTSASISVSNGEYQIGSNGWTSATGTVVSGDTVTVRHTSSANFSSSVDTVLTIGGVSDTFSSTTMAAPIFTVSATASPVAGGSVTCIPTSVTFGGSSSCSAVASIGYTFVGFSGSCTGLTCSMTNIQANQTVTAGFFLQAPTLTSMTPNHGPTDGGTLVSLTGNHFTAATTVTINARACTSPSATTATTLTCTTPSGAGIADVTVTNATGSVTGTGMFRYDAPIVTGVSPTHGPAAGGNMVTISGSNFVIGGTTATIGGNACTSPGLTSSTAMTCTAPAGTGTGAVVVTTASGNSGSSTTYTFDAVPVVNVITPNTGPTAGGALVTILGTGLTNPTAVTIDGNACTNITPVSPASLRCNTPAGVGLGKSVLVTTAGGTSTANTLFSYDAPSVSAINPTSGSIDGGTIVVITGTNLREATAITIGGNACIRPSLNTDTSVTCFTPAGSAGTASVVVTTASGSSSANTLFTYTVPAPSLSAITPSTGSTAGGTSVTISGSNLSGATGVTIGGVACTPLSANTATSVTCLSPAGTGLNKAVVVTTASGPSTDSVIFSYNGPSVSGITPNTGSTAGGTSVTISGSNLRSATAITIGGNACTSPSANSDTAVTCTTPAGSAGTASVVVTTASGSNSANTLFTYTGQTQTITFAPASPVNVGVSPITLTASASSGLTSFTFSTSSANTICTVSGNTLTIVGAGTCALTATQAGNATYASASANANVVINAVPAVSAITPSTGSTAGGTSVTISGTNLSGATGVTIGGAACTSLSANTATSVTCLSPAGTGLNKAVVVTTASGPSTDSVSFSYNGPSVSGITPNTGSTAGGTSVTISGSNLRSATGITIGGNACTSPSANSDTAVTCTTPAGSAGTASVIVSTASGSSSANTLFTYTAASYTISTTASPSMGGTVSCTPNPVTHGSNSICTATANTGYTFGGFSGDCTGATCNLSNVTSAKSVTATFTPTLVNAVCGADHNAILTSTPNHLCSAGTAGLLSGSGPWNWTCEGSNGGAPASCSAAIQTWTASVNPSSHGTLSPASATANHAQRLSFTVTPDSGFGIGSVTGCNGGLSGNTYTTGPMTGACSISANFTAVAVNGSCGADQGQTLIASPTQLCQSGNASLVYGSGPWNWTCAGVNAGTSASCSANAQSYTVSATAGSGGSITPNSRTVVHGGITSVSVSANSGFITSSVSGCNGTLSGNVFTTGAITANCAINASFAATNTTVSISSVTPSPAKAGQAVNVSFSVNASSGIVNGADIVTVSDNNGVICTADVTTGQCTLTFPSAGTRNLVASYAGNGTAQASASTATTLSVVDQPGIVSLGLPSAVVGLPYTTQLVADGGLAPYAFSATGLPDGLGLNASTGLISGTPSSAGNASITVTLTDALAQSTNKVLVLQVVNGLTVATTSLPEGLVNQTYAQQLQALGGRAPYTWRLSSGQLPGGLQLDTTSGRLSGNPTSLGQSSEFTLEVTDADRRVATQTLTLTTRTPDTVKTDGAGNTLAANITPQTADANCVLDDSQTQVVNLGGAGAPTSAPANSTLAYGMLQFTMQGCTPGKTKLEVTVVYPDTLPAGTKYWKYGRTQDNTSPHWYVLNSAVISGNSVKFTVVDGAQGDDDLLANGSVTDPIAPIVSNLGITGSLGDGRVGASYVASLAVENGVGPFVWSVSAGQLPAGLTLGSTSGQISGTPTAAGPANLTVQVTDLGNGNATASKAFSVQIADANPPRLLNIATRGKVETVDNVMIAGFIIQGSSAKKVLIRARGPSLAAAPFNVPGTLADPFLTLYSGATPIDTNDDFAQHANAAQIPADWIPGNAKEAAIVTTLNPGAYTAIVNGVSSTSGVAIVEVFELDQPGTPLINIATRGPVQTGDNVMIAGLIIQGDAPKTVLITARGPSMAGPPHNVPGTLSDPVLTLYSGQTPIASNDNWPQAANAAQIQTAIGAPTNTLESAILITLQPGAYTAIVNGASNATGLGIVEVFAQ
jgi:hypothetical protein